MLRARLHSLCTMLVVDEQSSVRELCSVILTRQGYEVLTASDIDGAIRLCARLRWPEIKLVLLDALLPGQDCVRLVKILRLGGTRIHMLFLSAIPARDLASRFGVEAEYPVLQKPFTIPDLLEAVRTALHAPAPGTEIAH